MQSTSVYTHTHRHIHVYPLSMLVSHFLDVFIGVACDIFPCRLNIFHFSKDWLTRASQKSRSDGKATGNSQNTKAENCLRLTQFNELIFEYGLWNSDVIVESPSKVEKHQDKKSYIPTVGPMVPTAVRAAWKRV